MWKAAHNEDMSTDAIQRLEEYLAAEFGLYFGYESYEAWIMWRRSNYTVYPFEGGYWQQPKWIRDDFLMLDLRRQWHEQNAKRVDTSTMSNPFDDYKG